LRNHGGNRVGRWYEYEEAGFNYRLSDIQGAMGIAQMEKLPKLVKLKKNLAGQLIERLHDIPGIILPSDPPWGGHIYQSFVILIEEGLDRDQVMQSLSESQVECTLGTYALHDQPLFQREFGYRTGQLPKSHIAYTRSITLPLYPQMSERELDIISASLRKSVTG
jgi:perosamine synthetase